MAWTYLVPRSSLVVGSPTPTHSSFKLTTGTGIKFLPGPATIQGNECVVQSVVSDVVQLSAPVLYLPQTGDQFVQSIIGDKDKVRLHCGDTDSDDPQLQDEEIDALLGLKPNILMASSLACETIAAKLARKVTYQIYQEIQERLTDLSASYTREADRLRQLAVRMGASPMMGALLQADKDLAVQDVTKVKPFFTRAMQTEPGTELTDPDENASGFYQSSP